MYGIIKAVIERKDYELASILKKIDTLWAENELTDEQREELITLARENADPKNSYATLEKQVDSLFENMGEMGKTLTEVLTRLSVLEGEEVEPKEPTEEYPAWVQPTGAHDAYHNGDGMTYTDGIKYDCIAPEGVAVVWPPDVMPSYWKEVIGDEEETRESVTEGETK